MQIAAIEVFLASLPFRFAFKHKLAERSHSTNIIVRVRLDDGSVGFGEGVPREYVTGESTESAVLRIESELSPRLSSRLLPEPPALAEFLEREHDSLGLRDKRWGAAWCAVELAILDAVARSQNIRMSDLLDGARRPRIRYGAVVPFAPPPVVAMILCFYRLYGFKTVKLKVGRSLEEDLACVRLARAIMGADATLRVDANCAWSADEAIAAGKQLSRFGVASIEQPVAAGDIDALRRVSDSVEQEVIADEAVCTLADAVMLAQSRACYGFNIRLSKVGGLLAARRMAAIARNAGLSCHIGAQVGESGILSSAGRLLGCLEVPCSNYEGSSNAFLLKKDLTVENLTVGPGGWGQLLPGAGLGVTVREELLRPAGQERLLKWQSLEAAGYVN